MIAAVPTVSREEIREVLQELAAKGISIPEPQSVVVEASEDYDGDPIFSMIVTFAKRHKPEDLPWKLVSPLVRTLGRRVFARGGESRPVISEVRRLGEKIERTGI